MLDSWWWRWCYTSPAEEIPSDVRNGARDCGGECHRSTSSLPVVEVWQVNSASNECQWQCHQGLLDFEFFEEVHAKLRHI